MKINYTDGLLFSEITLVHRSQTMVVPRVVIDTGAAESIISIDIVDDLFQVYEPEDQIRFMVGIGGREAAIRRKIDLVSFHSFHLEDISMDFGRIGEYSDINGLIGLDVLIPGRFMVDLNRIQLYSALQDRQ